MKERCEGQHHPGVIPKREDVASRYMALSDMPVNALSVLGRRTLNGTTRQIEWISYPERPVSSIFDLGGFTTPYHFDQADLLLSALHFSCLMVEKNMRDGAIYLREADDEMKEIESLLPYWGRTGGVKGQAGFGGYEEAPGSFDRLVNLFERSATAANEIKMRLAMNIAEQNVMSKRASDFAAEIMMGWRSPPPRSKPTQRHRDILLVTIGKELRARARYPLSANSVAFDRGLLPKPCGCTIAAAALHAYGITITPKSADKIMKSRGNVDYQRIFHRHELVIEDGVLSQFSLRRNADMSDKVRLAMEYLLRPIY